MRLLIFTQSIDEKDPTLSAYHRLVNEIAKNFDSVLVICLKKGEYNLPQNTKVLSLGKEDGESRLKYLYRFYKYIFREDYDSVFVHMNQEYILLGGIFWKMMNKPVYMWRNHHAGSILTDIAAKFCKKVFCTSKFSFTAKYKKTLLMPVGIETEFFKKDLSTSYKPNSILFLARMAPVKKPHILLDALSILNRRGDNFTADFIGNPLKGDIDYYNSLKEKAKKIDGVNFEEGIPNNQTPASYSSHSIFVNLSSSGMYDKTIFEAMACESLVVATNKNLYGLIDDRFVAKEDDVDDIAQRIENLLKLSQTERTSLGRQLRNITETHHSLKLLGEKLAKEIS